MGRHQVLGLIDRIVDRAGDGVRRHRFPHHAIDRIQPLGDAAHHDVAIGEHAYQPFVLDHQQAADIMVAHPARGRGQGDVRADGRDLTLHDIFDQHGRLSKGLRSRWRRGRADRRPAFALWLPPISAQSSSGSLEHLSPTVRRLESPAANGGERWSSARILVTSRWFRSRAETARSRLRTSSRSGAEQARFQGRHRCCARHRR